MIPFQLPNDGQVTDTPVFLDQFGRPCPAPASLTWAPGDTSIATLTVASDGMSAVITPIAASGVYRYGVAIGGTSMVYTQEIDIVEPVPSSIAPGLGAIVAKA